MSICARVNIVLDIYYFGLIGRCKMKNFKLEKREYKSVDFLKIPFRVSLMMAFLYAMFARVIYAFIPSLQVLATASFIDTSIDIYNDKVSKQHIILPIICILLLVSYEYFLVITGFAHEKLKMDLTEKFQTAVTEKRAKLKYSHIENDETWNLIERVGRDAALKIDTGFDNILRIIEVLIRISTVLLILLIKVWWATVLIIACSIPLFIVAVKSGKTNYDQSKVAAKFMRKTSYIQEVLTDRKYIEERSLFEYTDKLNEKYKKEYLAAYKIQYKAAAKRFIKMKSSSVITIIISVLIAGLLISPLKSGQISMGMFMSLVSATFGLVYMMSWELMYVTSEFANAREYMKDFTTFCNLSETEGALDLPKRVDYTFSCIEFRNVSFTYPGTEKKILDNLSMKMYANTHYAFVGSNGAGKTTITKLLTGMYDNYTGDIFIDNRNLRDFSQAELKGIFSIVYQDFAKYQITLVDSIGIGNIYDLSYGKIKETVEVLGMCDVIEKLPNSYDNSLGKIKSDGVDLSGGEWQKIAIARTLLNPAPIRILDEPTAALDPVAESNLYKLFGMLSEDTSTIFITHRLGASKLADTIFVIENGRVVEQGTHDELMEINGIYTEMFNSQRGWYQ